MRKLQVQICEVILLMKIGIYSDVHASNTSSIMPLYCKDSKYSLRLQMIIDSFKWMYNVFDKQGVGLIFNLGDLFDSHTISSHEITAMSDAYSYSNGIHEIHITGNHETLDKNREFYSTALLSNVEFIQMYNKPQKCKYLDFEFSLLPHMKSDLINDDLLSSIKSDILFSHIDIKGSHLRPDYTLDGGIEPEKLSMYFDTVFNGHLHTAETISTSSGTVMNIGAFSSNSFNDSNSYIPSILVYDTETRDIERFRNPNAILFRRVSCSSVHEVKKYIDGLDSKYRYIIRIKVPYSIKDNVRSVIKEIDNIVAYRIVSSLSGDSNGGSKIIRDSINDKIVDDEFISFIEDNQDLIKYPLTLYKSIIDEIKK